MLRFDVKNLVKAALVSAVLAAPMVAGAQPFTIITQFTNPVSVGNPVTPIAVPTVGGSYGLVVYIARGGPGVPAIAPANRTYISGASVRIYYAADQLSQVPTAPGGVPANIQLDEAGAVRVPSLPTGVTLGTQQNEVGNEDGNAATTHRKTATVNFATGDPTAPLISNLSQLPSDWSYASPNNAAGTFTPLVATNIVTLTPAGQPLDEPIAVAATMQPVNGTIANRFISNNSNATAAPVTAANNNGGNSTPLAVDLTSLTATVVGSTATISWSTAAEYDNAGFVVYRADANGDLGEAISTLVAAEGSAASGATYSVVDPAPLAPGETRSYYLADIDLSGATTVHGPVMVTRGAASSVSGWELY